MDDFFVINEIIPEGSRKPNNFWLWLQQRKNNKMIFS